MQFAFQRTNIPKWLYANQLHIWQPRFRVSQKASVRIGSFSDLKEVAILNDIEPAWIEARYAKDF